MHRSLFGFLLILLLMMSSGPVFARNNHRQTEPCVPPEQAAAEQPAEDPVDTYVNGWTKTEGLFTYYTDPSTKRVVLCLTPDKLEQVNFISMTLTKGTGDEMLTAPMMLNQSAFKFRRVGQSIEFYQPNYTFTLTDGDPVSKAIQNGVSEVIIGRTPIEAESTTDGRMVIDLATLLLGALGIDQGSMTLGGTLAVNPDGSYVETIKGFPKNDEIDARVAVMGASDPWGYPINGESRVGVHYSLAVPPDPGYMPRLGDDRVGYFVNLALDYSSKTDSEDTRYVRYINRWRLQKANPNAAMSDPVEPIVFWLENTIPVEYRDAVRDGILLWNKAFERIGISNAIVVKQQPDDADWDAADARYHTIRWFVSPASSYAIGPCYSDPRTGEIYDADIGVSADMLRIPFLDLQFTTGPLHDALTLLSAPGWPNLNGRQVKWDDKTLAQVEGRVKSAQMNSNLDLFPAVHEIEGARGIIALQARGLMAPGSPEEKKYVHDYIASLIVHEVGHTLGLRHNFAGSSGTPYSKLNDESWTREHGLAQSVMDYTMTNLSPNGQLQGEYFQTELGDYDYWAIEYGYKPIVARTSQDELPELQKIASRAPLYRYGTDEDAGGWSFNPDPDCFYWDMTDNPVRWYTDQMTVSDQLLDGILAHWDEPGTRPAKIRNAFNYALVNYLFASRMVPKLIGGIRINRDHVGDPGARPPMSPVSAQEQRDALKFLNDKIWNSETFTFDPKLLSMLGIDRLERFELTDADYGVRDFDIHSWVLDAQSAPFYWIYDPVVLQRVLNNEMRTPDGQDKFTITELFDSVRHSIWSELATGSNIDSYRRNLQRAHLEMLTGIVLQPSPGTPQDAITLARHDLVSLRNTISSILNGNQKAGLDELTVAHLEETLSKIDLTLSAPMDRGGGMNIPMILLQ